MTVSGGKLPRRASGGLGDLERLVLLAVLRLGDRAYAVSVRNEIEARTGRSLSRGAVYVTLDRLQGKGHLRSRLGDPTPERGGKARRLFRIEPGGLAALQASLEEIRGMMLGMDDHLALGWSP